MKNFIAIALLLLTGCITAPKTPKAPTQKQLPAESLQPWVPNMFMQGDNPYAPQFGDPLSIKTF